MRPPLAFATALALATVVVAFACAPVDDAGGDVCEQAKAVFGRCGASLPLLTDKPCTGMTRVFARCVTRHATTCDELASLAGRIDACVADEADGGELAPAEDLVPPVFGDGGRGIDARSVADAAQSPPDARTPVDAGPDVEPSVDASVPWLGLDATGTVTSAQYDRYTTPTLPAGTYTFVMTGTGDADLYIKRSSAPAINSYDCRPYQVGSDESCTMVLAVPAVLHIGIRGAAASSTYRIIGKP